MMTDIDEQGRVSVDLQCKVLTQKRSFDPFVFRETREYPLTTLHYTESYHWLIRVVSLSILVSIE